MTSHPLNLVSESAERFLECEKNQAHNRHNRFGVSPYYYVTYAIRKAHFFPIHLKFHSVFVIIKII